MTLFAIALYLIPVVLAVVALLIGVEALKFTWFEVIIGRDEGEDER